MKAIVLTGYGGVEMLQTRDVPEPQPGARQVKVRVAGASINPVDWKIRRGDLRAAMPLELPTILGRDVAGEVVAVGQAVTELGVGDRVMGLVQHGYAEYVVGAVEAFARLPDELEIDRAGALPLVGLTGAQLIEEALAPKAGQVVLVTGAVGSVGRVAVYAAKRLGVRVIAGVRARQRDAAEKLEVDGVIAIDDAVDLKRLPALDGIADTVDGVTVEEPIRNLRSGGAVASVLALPADALGPDIRARSMRTHPDAKRLEQLGHAVVKGELVLPIDRRFPLEAASEAQALAEGGGIGKVLLLPHGAHHGHGAPV